MNISVRVLSANARTQIAALRAQVAALEGQLATANRTAAAPTGIGSARSRKSLMAYGNQVQWTGRMLQYNFTLPILLAGAAATKFALDNEKAMTRVIKVYGDADDAAQWFRKHQSEIPKGMSAIDAAAAAQRNELKALEDAFEALSQKYGVVQKDVLETAGAWAAAGSSGVALAKSVDLSLRASVLGDMDLAKATEALIAIQAQYSLNTKELTQTLADLNAVENATGISMQGLIEGFSRSAGVAREAGVDWKHLSAMLAALVPASGSAATAGQGLKTIISRLLTPTGDAAAVMKEFGINTADAAWKMSTGTERLQILANHMNGTLKKTGKATKDTSDDMYELSDAQKSVVATTLGSRYQMNRFLVLMREMGPEASYYEKALSATSSSTKTFNLAQKELQDVLSSSPKRLEIMWVTLQNGMADAIQPMIPYIIYLAQTVGQLVNKFNSLNPEVQKLIMIFALGLALVGPFVRYMGALATLIGWMVTPMKVLSAWWVTLTTVQKMHNGVLIQSRVSFLGLIGSMVAAPFRLIASGFGLIAGAAGSLTTGVLATMGGTFKTAMRASEGEVRRGGVAKAYMWMWGSVSKIARAGVAGLLSMQLLFGSADIAQTLGNETAKTSIVGSAYAQRAAAAATGLRGVVGAETAASAAVTTAVATMASSTLATEAASAASREQIHAALYTYMTNLVNGYNAARYGIEAGTSASILALEAGTSASRLTAYQVYYSTLMALEAGTISTRTANIVRFEAAVIAAESASHSRRAGLYAALYQLLLGMERAYHMAFFSLEAGASASYLALTASTMGTATQIHNAYHAYLMTLERLSFSNRMGLAAASSTSMIALNAGTQGTLTAIEAGGHGTRLALNAGAAATTLSIWQRTWITLVAITKGGAAGVLLVFNRLLAMVARVLIGWVPLAIALVAGLMYGMRDKVAEGWNAIVAYFSDSSNAVVSVVVKAWNMLPSAVSGSLVAVANVVRDAALAIYEWFSYINPFARHSPSLVENVTNGMKIVGDQFGLAASTIKNHVRGAYSDIKMFGSAIANLLGGAANFEQAQQRAKIKKFAPGALEEFDALVARLKVLQGDLAGLQSRMDKQQAVVDKWAAAVDRANVALDVQQDKLDRLSSIQDKWQAKLESAQAKMSKFANAPIRGMGAMSDKIFENEMAQKRLRLEMMRMEEVGGTLDDVRAKIEALNGAQESLRGEQAALRSAGAGSDILSQYDEQIAALEATKKQQNDTAESINNLTKQLDELGRKGEILDLQNSLQFDPLTRQIEKAANAMEEMPFDKIMKGVTSAAVDIAKYQDKLDAATKAVDKQKAVVDKLTAARDLLADRLDAEEAKLAKIKDAYDEVADAIRSVEQAMSDAAGASDTMAKKAEEVKAKKKGADSVSPAVQNFRDAAGGNFAQVGGAGIPTRKDWGEQTKAIEDFVKKTTDDASKAFSDLNPFAPITRRWGKFRDWMKEQWGNLKSSLPDLLEGAGDATGIDFGAVGGKIKAAFSGAGVWINKEIIKPLRILWGLFGPDLVDIVKNTWAGMQEGFEKIRPSVMEFVDAVSKMGPAFKGIWNILKVLIGVVGAVLVAIVKVVLSVFARVVRPVLSMIGGLISAAIKIFTGFFQLIAGLFTIFSGDITGGLKMMWDGVVNIFKGTLNAIGEIFKGAFGGIVGGFMGIVDAVIDGAYWLYDVMVGHSIIPDLVNKIIEIFKWLGIVPKWLWNNVLHPIVKFFMDVYNKVAASLRSWWGMMKLAWTGMKVAGTWVWDNVLKPVWNKVTGLGTDVKQEFGKWTGRIKDAWSGLKGMGDWVYDNMMKPVYNKITGVWKSIKDWFVDNKNLFTSPIKSIVNVVIDAVNSIVKGLNTVANVLPGVDWHIDTVQRLAQGGEMGRKATRGFKTNGARAIVGEGKRNHPEFVIPTDPTYRSRARTLLAMAASRIGVTPGVDTRHAMGDRGSDIARVAKGNPTAALTAIPEYAKGGWLGKLIDKSKGGAKRLAKEIADLPRNAAGKVMDPLLDSARKTVNDNTAGWKPIQSPPNYALNKLEGWVKNTDSDMNGRIEKAKDQTSGGPKARQALKWARSEAGKPYIWGGVGPAGYDCSGYMSAITNILQGRNAHSRVGTTGTFPWPGWEKGAQPKGFTIGSSRSYAGGIGHMAGTLAGVNVESAGGIGTRVGAAARGYNDPGFTSQYHLPLKEGGIALARKGPTLAAIGDGRYDEAVVPLPKGWRNGTIGSGGGDRIININGNLSFPNIKSGSDAKTFLDNLENLAED